MQRGGGERAVEDRRTAVAVLVTYAAVGKTFWQLAHTAHSPMFGDMFAQLPEGDRERERGGGREKRQTARQGVR